MTDSVDLIVVGAGIQGAGVAQCAAAAGYRVLILEQSAIAAGTSSRSSKLIHGGLRYLETAQLRLVRESLRERTALLRLAPDLVHLTPHYIPVYRHTRRRPLTLRLGLSLYALLGGLQPAVRFARLARSQWPSLDGLVLQDLQAVFRYFDAQTDDAALTRAVMHSAQTLGARLEMPATFLNAQLESTALRVRYRLQGREHEVQCRALINAAGPWVNQVLAAISPPTAGLSIDCVAGSHIVLPRSLTRGVYYTEAPQDGRAVFIMPWQGEHTLVGTTERLFHGEPAAVAPTAAEIEYLLTVVRHYFPRYAGVQPITSFAGLRVLPASGGQIFARSRDTQLLPTHSGRVLSIYGGKLTVFRATAAAVLQLMRPLLPPRQAQADWTQLTLQPESSTTR